ncbi:MAG: ATP-binding cassette domain-containing protein [Patescibacteria group bacterium]
MIKLTNISKIYPPDITALTDINLEIKEGEFISIVGRSGVGKTTLVKLLIAEEKPTSGKIEVLGWEVSRLKKRDIPYYRRQIGVVFQDFKLLESKTAYENVAFTLMVCDISPSKIKKLVPQALALVGLGGKEKRFPKELSGGEKQRLAIARAFVHRPKILIADELTGELDALYAWEIAEILIKINKLGATVMLSTHDRDIVNRLRRRVVTLEEGKIIRDQKIGEYLI